MGRAQYEAQRELLIEVDNEEGVILKLLLQKHSLTDLENCAAHIINTLLENNRVLVYSLERDFNMTAGSSLRNLLEACANYNYILKHSQKEECAAKFIAAAFQYAKTLETIIVERKAAERLKTVLWTESNISQRVGKLGDGPLFQYEILSRYTHADMWAAVNDILVGDKDAFWAKLLRWGVDFNLLTLDLIMGEHDMPEEITKRVQELNKALQALND